MFGGNRRYGRGSLQAFLYSYPTDALLSTIPCLHLTGWKTVEINGIEFELNSILVEKWKGKPYRLVIQRQRRIDGDLWHLGEEYTYRCILTNDYKSSAKRHRGILIFVVARNASSMTWTMALAGIDCQNRSWHRILYSCLWQLSSETSTKLLCRDWKNHEFGLRATSRIKTFVSSSSLFLQNGLRHHVGTYWTFIQTTMLMPTCSRTDFWLKGHAFLVKPAYYLKSLYGVRGFCVCDISVVQEICTIKWILSLMLSQKWMEWKKQQKCTKCPTKYEMNASLTILSQFKWNGTMEWKGNQQIQQSRHPAAPVACSGNCSLTQQSQTATHGTNHLASKPPTR